MKQINWGFIGCGEVTEQKSGPAFNLVAGSHILIILIQFKTNISTSWTYF